MNRRMKVHCYIFTICILFIKHKLSLLEEALYKANTGDPRIMFGVIQPYRATHGLNSSYYYYWILSQV